MGISTPRTPKPWYNRERKSWFVAIGGVHRNLGPDKKAAQDEFHRLMRLPQEKRSVRSELVVAIIDAYLEWTQNRRSPETYEWYRYRLQRFVDRFPKLTVAELRPYSQPELSRFLSPPQNPGNLEVWKTLAS